ncbi:MAG TPA: PAAR domain-containing protein [Actinomycetota bacterium]|nr:PAAR domain-containing protein [Actinomycetota bacterium]
MPPIARVGDPSDLPGVITGPGVPTVLVAGQPAAVMGDLHSCAWARASGHPPTPLTASNATVLIVGRPVICVGDRAGCGAVIMSGAFTVLVG